MKLEILDRRNGTVLFGIELPAEIAGLAYGARLGWAVIKAIAARANLTDANLTDANLTDADLTDADLTAADLTRANLTAANLTAANLTDADLTRANLTAADLQAIKADLFLVLVPLASEAPNLLEALNNGHVDGSTYTGTCACLIGTLAKSKKCHYSELVVEADSSRPIERFFMGIKKGDKPETNQASKLASEWVAEFIACVSPKVGGAV